jgi:eukaryotic-like serine/threonine-protein kinase
MELPRVEGMELGELIGHGGCGRVFQMKDGEGNARAVKVFNPAMISVTLLEKMTERLEAGGWPDGVMPVLSADLGAKEPFWITPLLAGMEAELVPRNLQMSLGEYPGTQSWRLVKSLARALAAMHGKRVAHGNLKPGNVFFDNHGSALLSDWAMGNMPGTMQFMFTDAVLYQSPEQLREPAGYLDEAGYRWDVFAFGVLAYRILTGKFPRCQATFQVVAPPPGVMRKEGIQADLAKIALSLEKQPDVVWPDGAPGPLEVGFREWIDRCLLLDPVRRPASMVEVAAGFEALQTKADLASEREALLDQRRHAERRAWRTLWVAGITSVSAVAFGGLWLLEDSQQVKERADGAAKAAELKQFADSADEARIAAETAMARAEQALEHERELSLARLEASRMMGDRLFVWAMENGNRRLPPLEGRESRLKKLEAYFEDFLTRTSGLGILAQERARVRLQLAEISLAAGDAAQAGERLREALETTNELPMEPELTLRLGTNALLLALLKQVGADPDTEAAFVAARKALEAVPQADVDTDRLHQLLAILDFHEAQILTTRGEDARALEQLMRATETLNRISDLRPEAAILRSELAACYLSSATILEGMGSLGDAREVRNLASVELVKLLKESPEDFALRLELAGCYGAMAEAAASSGDLTGAESLSREAMKLLDRLVAEQPDNASAVSRKASQLGLRAGIQRDRGFSAEAMKDYEEAISMLEVIRKSAPSNAMASYRLAILWWQKGRMLGMAGERPDEIELLRKARDLLLQLETDRSPIGPRPDQLQSSGAYLLGDLGHALQLAGRRDDAVAAFREAASLWENLLKSRPASEEYSEALAWCQQRLGDLD